MSVRTTKAGLWKLVVTIVVGAVTLFVYIIQLENWQFSKLRSSSLNHASNIHKKVDKNVTSKFVLNVNYSKIIDKVILRRNPYITDANCRNFSLSLFEDDTFELTGLVSYPGSGNTWTRHLIQLATGIYTGSFYFDMELFARGFLGEREAWYSGGTVVQKFHEKYNKKFNIDRAILLIREPFSAILSFANYLEAGHTGNAYRLPHHHKDWPKFLLQSAYNWLTLAKTWIESPATLLIMHYEHLRQHPLENMIKICKFLNHSCPHLSSPCFQKKMEGSFHRNSRLSSRSLKKDEIRQSIYPEEIMNIISRGIDHLDNLLRFHGYEPIPLNLYQHYSTKKSDLS